MTKKVCVFCGARFGNSKIYEEVATELGKELARRGHSLVYGGGSVGLMGATARATLESGGKVYGVFPRFLEAKEACLIADGIENCFVDTMDVRKVKMYTESDAVIAMPGGFGTMDELFEVLTLKQVGQFDKPIGVLNVEGYYDPLITFIRHTVERGFVGIENLEYFFDRDNIGDLLDAMEL